MCIDSKKEANRESPDLDPSNADQEITIPEDKVQEWPEMLGQKGAYAVVYIKQKTGRYRLGFDAGILSQIHRNL